MKQQDQAVKVHDPLVLAEYFEALIGTSGYVTSIAKTRQGLSERIKVCEVLQATIERQAPIPLLTIAGYCHYWLM